MVLIFYILVIYFLSASLLGQVNVTVVREDVENGGDVEWKPSLHVETVLRSSGDGLSVVQSHCTILCVLEYYIQYLFNRIFSRLSLFVASIISPAFYPCLPFVFLSRPFLPFLISSSFFLIVVLFLSAHHHHLLNSTVPSSH